MSQIHGALLSTPCQLRAMWHGLYLQEEVLYNRVTVKYYPVQLMPLAWKVAPGTHLIAVGFLSVLSNSCPPNFARKPGQRVRLSVQWRDLSHWAQTSWYKMTWWQKKPHLAWSQLCLTTGSTQTSQEKTYQTLGKVFSLHFLLFP